MSILRGPDNHLTKTMTEFEKSLGVDLKLTPDGDLELSNLNDIKLVSGAANAAQAIFIKLNIEPGALVYHPDIGTNLQVGNKTKNALAIKVQVLNSLLKDPRFSNVDANINVLGDIVLVDLRVTLANTGIEVPLQFATPT